MSAELSPMPVTALSSWYGSKRTLASTIIEELGPHRAYWEAMCGSMANLLAKPVASMETAAPRFESAVSSISAWRRRLAKALRRFTKTRVVVSYYDHDDLDALYPGWTKRHRTEAAVPVAAADFEALRESGFIRVSIETDYHAGVQNTRDANYRQGYEAGLRNGFEMGDSLRRLEALCN